MAFRVCRDIKCPHPNQLEKFGIGIDELTDWWAVYAYENDQGKVHSDKPTDAQNIETLKRLKQEWGG